ncbi:MAG: hypothetical protein KGR98_12520, partial [Verrucomicrobia bacterium]|nr:hypothetical protein [Verrucomicrobiota bacterium]
NGLVYLVLAAVLIYNYSYWTVQMASSNREAAAIRLLNRAGRDLDATGMSSVARAVDPMPARYYKLADLAGLLYQNHDLKERLADYPAFLGLAERSDFKQLGKDEAFQEAWQGHAPLGELLNSPGAKAILDTPSVAGMVLAMVETNLDDLQTYLKTGKSPKYDSEPILGRWHVNVPASLAVETQSQTNMPLPAFQGLEALWERAYGNTRLVADARGEVFLDNMANIRTAPKRMPTVQMENESGQWTGDGLDYQFTFGGNKTAAGKTDGLRLRFIMAGKTLIFDR